MSRIFAWVLAAVVGALYAYLGAFKFMAAPLTQWIFAKSGAFIGLGGLMEPYGRLATGVAELLTVLLILVLPIILALQKKPASAAKTQAYGALLGLIIVSGAILFHLFALGVSTPADAIVAESLAPGGAPLPRGGFVNPDSAVGESPALFIMAAISFVACAGLLWLRRNAIVKKD